MGKSTIYKWQFSIAMLVYKEGKYSSTIEHTTPFLLVQIHPTNTKMFVISEFTTVMAQLTVIFMGLFHDI